MNGATVNRKTETVTPRKLLSEKRKKDEEKQTLLLGMIINNKYKVQDIIGKGRYSTIYKCKVVGENRLLALKITTCSTFAIEEKAKEEVELLTALNEEDHTDNFHILKIYDNFSWSLFKENEYFVIAMELLSITLDDLIYNKNPEFQDGVSLNLTKKIARQLCLVFLYIKSLGIDLVHCNLNPKNILLCDRQKAKIKVSGWGNALYGKSLPFCERNDGNKYYRAPEILFKLRFSAEVDMWSIGCILCELYTGKKLFVGRDDLEKAILMYATLGLPTTAMIKSKTFNIFSFNNDNKKYEIDDVYKKALKSRSLKSILEVPKHDSDNNMYHFQRLSDFEDFLLKIFCYEPKDRITPDDALKHVFFFE